MCDFDSGQPRYLIMRDFRQNRPTERFEIWLATMMIRANPVSATCKLTRIAGMVMD
jgi:hypothetical protein